MNYELYLPRLFEGVRDVERVNCYRVDLQHEDLYCVALLGDIKKDETDESSTPTPTN